MLLDVPYKIGLKRKREFLGSLEGTLRCYPFPPQIIVESTAACNLRCIHCGHATMKRRRGTMREELWRKIVGEIALRDPTTEVWPTFYGEALLIQMRIIERIRYAASKGLTNLVLNTNGTMLTDEMILALIDSGLSRLIVSLDGFTKETFERIRVGASHERVYRQAERLLELKRKCGAHHLRVEMQFSLMEENETEAEDFRKYWLERGACVKTREKVTWSGTKQAPNLYPELERIACPWALRTCAIQWNGDLVACACDYEGVFVAGNIREDSIERIWNTKHREFEELHLKHEFDQLPDLCQGCLDWQVGGGARLEGVSSS